MRESDVTFFRKILSFTPMDGSGRRKKALPFCLSLRLDPCRLLRERRLLRCLREPWRYFVLLPRRLRPVLSELVDEESSESELGLSESLDELVLASSPSESSPGPPVAVRRVRREDPWESCGLTWLRARVRSIVGAFLSGRSSCFHAKAISRRQASSKRNNGMITDTFVFAVRCFPVRMNSLNGRVENCQIPTGQQPVPTLKSCPRWTAIGAVDAPRGNCPSASVVVGFLQCKSPTQLHQFPYKVSRHVTPYKKTRYVAISIDFLTQHLGIALQVLLLGTAVSMGRNYQEPPSIS
mmetsp:Transcript_11121/g.20573  ORF Transcript_11121/g.20573 Transcript_11121/m.20573 type:complete len:295 (-) Transcript_11121:385-1269(-)